MSSRETSPLPDSPRKAPSVASPESPPPESYEDPFWEAGSSAGPSGSGGTGEIIPDDLPEGWEVHTSERSGITYYVNKKIKKAQWDPPDAEQSTSGQSSSARSPSGRSPSGRSPSGRSPQSPFAHPSASNYFSSAHSGMPRIQKLSKREIRCSHILIKHDDCTRPESWRSDDIRRSKAEALQVINGFRRQIMITGASFEELAKIFSECTSAKHHGDLGRFRRGQMQKAFEDVAFKLQIGELSEAVETPSGYHLILRTQ